MVMNDDDDSDDVEVVVTGGDHGLEDHDDVGGDAQLKGEMGDGQLRRIPQLLLCVRRRKVN